MLGEGLGGQQELELGLGLGGQQELEWLRVRGTAGTGVAAEAGVRWCIQCAQ